MLLLLDPVISAMETYFSMSSEAMSNRKFKQSDSYQNADRSIDDRAEKEKEKEN